MSSSTIIILVACGVFLLIVLAIVLVHLSNKRRSNNIDSQLKQFKSEQTSAPIDEKIILSKDTPVQTYENVKDAEEKKEVVEAEEKQSSGPPVIEDYINSQEYLGRSTNTNKKITTKPKPYIRQSNDRIKPNNMSDQMRDKEFEDFLNEHALSRRILNKDILEKLKDLPPDIKAIILSNVFNKYDDN